jgi:hypothetical protein
LARNRIHAVAPKGKDDKIYENILHENLMISNDRD